MLLITGGASDLQRLLILMLALRSMPHIAICTVRHSWLRCILLSLSPLAVLPCVPFVGSATWPESTLHNCDSYRRHATLTVACLAEMVHRRAPSARPSTRPSLTSCGRLRAPLLAQGVGHNAGQGSGSALVLVPWLALWWALILCLCNGHRATMHMLCCQQCLLLYRLSSKRAECPFATMASA